MNCSTAMATQYSVEDFAKTREDMTVPYVVDFSGGESDRMQRPVPRPFYCSKYKSESGLTFGAGEHAWFFYTLPNEISTSNLNEIFVELD
ncbi:MAG: hypothetical protein K8I82_11795 [Anaerolineae bacterium]|nr:hypothetical protein [Anaerolineae bacterium]